MADILKYGNAIRLAQLASDPAGVENGTIYYNTTDGVVKQYIGGGWQEIPDQALTLIGLALNDGNLIVGDGSNVSVAVDTASVGDIDADSTAGLTIKAGVIVNADINASAAIALSKLAALTASRALQSDGSGVISASSVTSTELGYVSGVTSAIQTQLGNKQSTSEKGQANGYASLDGSGKVPVAQLPNAIMEYQGTWNASTNSPTLADGAGSIGDVYRVSVAGTQDLGSGNITFAVGDYAILNASLVWEKADTTDAVSSVNSQTGAVVLDSDDISEGITNLYFTDERAQDAVGAMVANSSKVSLTYVDGTPSLTADIVSGSLVNADINASAAIDASKIADGSVSNAEFQRLDGVTSAIQTQIDGKASTTLNNLGTTSINANLIADTTTTRDLGSSTVLWNNIYVSTSRGAHYLTNRSSITRGALRAVISSDSITRPDGTTMNGSFLRGGDNSGDNFTVYTSNQAAADAVATTAIDIQTGNKTGGTGNSGAINLVTGTSAGGSRGDIKLDAFKIDLRTSIIPNSTNTYDLGSSGNKCANLYLGNSLVLEDPGVGASTTTIQAFSGGSTYTITLPTNVPASTQAVMMSNTGQLSTQAVAAASAGDISETSYTGLANNTANQVITGLQFANATVRSFKAQLSILVDATTDQFAVYELMGIQRGSDWQMSESFTGDSISGLTFDITAAGQVRASIGNITGFSSATIKFRAQTLSV